MNNGNTIDASALRNAFMNTDGNLETYSFDGDKDVVRNHLGDNLLVFANAMAKKRPNTKKAEIAFVSVSPTAEKLANFSS